MSNDNNGFSRKAIKQQEGARLYDAIYAECKKNGVCRMTNKELTELAGMRSEGSMDRALSQLEIDRKIYRKKIMKKRIIFINEGNELASVTDEEWKLMGQACNLITEYEQRLDTLNDPKEMVFDRHSVRAYTVFNYIQKTVREYGICLHDSEDLTHKVDASTGLYIEPKHMEGYLKYLTSTGSIAVSHYEGISLITATRNPIHE